MNRSVKSLNSIGCVLSLFLVSQALLADPLDLPNSSVSFIVNQTLTPAFGIVNDPIRAQNSVASAVGSPYTYAGIAWATYGAVGASSSFSDAHVPVPSHGLLSIGSFVDQVYVTAAGSSSTTYRWTPTVHLTGLATWTENGVSPGGSLWSVSVASSQGVKTAADTKYAFKSSPDLFPGKGVPIDMLFALPEVIVPANEWFNYRFQFLVNARVLNSGGYSVSAADGNFLGTLRVVGLDIKDISGTSLDFNVKSASGSSYTSAGIGAIPEPSTIGLASVGVLLLAWRISRLRM